MSTEAEIARNTERAASIGAPVATPRPNLNAFLEELLGEQQRLQTPAARFAEQHSSLVARHTSLHAELIPLSAPGPGEQYAFEVDLDSCSGCKACVAGCHSLNGLDEEETWRDVGLVLGGNTKNPFQQTITSACHHCADPACANGCPVLAYEKDPVTGIVRHLDDQCIGCSYCILKCPYDVPKFNSRLGIVRKCDMCHGRLAEGEAPACVQACPTHAIKITKVSVSNAGPALQVSGFLPVTVAPEPSYTRPTTRYVTKRTLPFNLRPADAVALRLQPAHWPLVALLTLMAMAVGCSMVDKIFAPATPALAVAGWFAGAVGLAFSVLHLGQPTRAWRIFLGLRKSWLSREAVIFGAWFPLATVYTAVRLDWLPLVPGPFRMTLALGTAALGATGLFCSVMIYADTRRRFWRFASGAPRIFGSALTLGLASALAWAPTPTVAGALTVVMVVKLALEMRTLRPLDADDRDDDAPGPALQTARLLTGPLRRVFSGRIAAGLFVSLAPLLTLASHDSASLVNTFVLAAALAGELAERYLFFRAVDAPKMPGVPAP